MSNNQGDQSAQGNQSAQGGKGSKRGKGGKGGEHWTCFVVCGPPGTGKTFTAAALAKKKNIPFVDSDENNQNVPKGDFVFAGNVAPDKMKTRFPKHTCVFILPAETKTPLGWYFLLMLCATTLFARTEETHPSWKKALGKAEEKGEKEKAEVFQKLRNQFWKEHHMKFLSRSFIGEKVIWVNYLNPIPDTIAVGYHTINSCNKAGNEINITSFRRPVEDIVKDILEASEVDGEPLQNFHPVIESVQKVDFLTSLVFVLTVPFVIWGILTQNEMYYGINFPADQKEELLKNIKDFENQEMCANLSESCMGAFHMTLNYNRKPAEEKRGEKVNVLVTRFFFHKETQLRVAEVFYLGQSYHITIGKPLVPPKMAGDLINCFPSNHASVSGEVMKIENHRRNLIITLAIQTFGQSSSSQNLPEIRPATPEELKKALTSLGYSGNSQKLSALVCVFGLVTTVIVSVKGHDDKTYLSSPEIMKKITRGGGYVFFDNKSFQVFGLPKFFGTDEVEDTESDVATSYSTKINGKNFTVTCHLIDDNVVLTFSSKRAGYTVFFKADEAKEEAHKALYHYQTEVEKDNIHALSEGTLLFWIRYLSMSVETRTSFLEFANEKTLIFEIDDGRHFVVRPSIDLVFTQMTHFRDSVVCLADGDLSKMRTFGFQLADFYPTSKSVSSLVDELVLTIGSEGYVVRKTNGQLVKLKTDWYNFMKFFIRSLLLSFLSFHIKGEGSWEGLNEEFEKKQKMFQDTYSKNFISSPFGTTSHTWAEASFFFVEKTIDLITTNKLNPKCLEGYNMQAGFATYFDWFWQQDWTKSNM
jgi:hypothetical protein